MEPFAEYRKLLTWYCVYQAAKNISKLAKSLHIIFCACVFLGNICATISSTIYFLKFLSIDLGSSLYALFQITSTGSGAYGIILLLVIRHKITTNFENLSKIYKKCNF